MGRGSKNGVKCCPGSSSNSSSESSISEASQEIFNEVCPPCIGNSIPRYFLISLSGISNGRCSNCNDLNGDYILEWVEGCQWCFEDIGHICSGFCTNRDFNLIRMNLTSLGISVGLSSSAANPCVGDCPSISWFLSGIVPKIDCTKISNLNIPFISHFGCRINFPTCSSTLVCDGSGSTCLLSSL